MAKPQPPAAAAHGHGHAATEEEFTLPHGSKYPIIAAMGVGLLYFGLAFGFPSKTLGLALFGIGALVTAWSAYQIVNEDKRWWNDKVSTGLRNGWWGVVFFLGTEVMLFAALFATYFNHASYGGATWGMDSHGAFWLEHATVTTGINTIILLLSGVTVHYAHSGIRKGNLKQLKVGLVATIILGAIFLAGQVVEYLELAHAGLIVQNGTFGAMFYMLTGTHGAHVLGGLLALIFVAWRAFQGQFDQERHVAVEVTAIYWHFVDVVWVLLYAVVYLRLF
jgi:cytochrome c oxidase subunit III